MQRSLALHRANSTLADRQIILNGFHARCGPRSMLGNAALVPRLDVTLEHDLAVGHVDADRVCFEFSAPL